MSPRTLLSALISLVSCVPAGAVDRPVPMSDPEDPVIPTEWVDADTGHRVVRLSRGPGEYRSYYFHNNPFFEDDAGAVRMAFNGSSPGDGQAFQPTTQQYWQRPSSNSVYTVELATGEVRHIARGPRSEMLGRKGRMVYGQTADGRAVEGIDLLSGERRRIVELPDGARVRLSTLNADETRMAGVIVDEPWPEGLERGNTKGERMRQTVAARQLRRLVVLDLETGELRTVLRGRHWYNHLQFSPVDPGLLMYCHEGPWHEMERIWTVRVDGEAEEVAEDGRRMLARTVDGEIWGHEWWDRDGRTIWCDHQIPRGKRFFVTGIDLATLATRRYELARNEWSVHFTNSPDGTLFAGDGGSPSMVAHAPDGKWIHLFRPDDRSGRLEATRLVNMKDHDYDLEPNVHFTPDQKWIVFRSNMHGRSHVYAVEVARRDG